MKILFFITGLYKSGAETQMINLIEQLHFKENISIKVVSLIEGYYESKLKQLDIDYSICSNNLNYNMFKYILFFKKEVSKFKPDIVHSFLFHSNIVSKIALLIMKKNFRLICSYRDTISNHPLIYQLEKINKYKTDAFISNSKQADCEIKYLKHSQSISEVIDNGVRFEKISQTNLEKLKKRYKNKKIILTIARFAEQKDYITNIKTCYELSKKREDFVFLYVGEGPKRDEITSLAQEYSVNKYITFLGRRDDIAELMTFSDVFFLPTLHESQSNVFIESMYYKLPIVTTNIKENRDLIKYAQFCKIKDYKKMATEINTILNRGFDKEKLDKNYLYTKEKFSLSSMTQNYYKIYKTLLK